MNRLTDEYIAVIARDTTDRAVRLLAIEVRDRRSADLTAQDLESLRFIRSSLLRSVDKIVSIGLGSDLLANEVAVLDKLIGDIK